MPSGVQYGLILVFFIYGLSFFTMGLAFVLESSRTQILGSQQMVRPLALFGILHGVHEWLEMFLIQSAWYGQRMPIEVSLLRTTLLATSFFPLVLYGALSLPRRKGRFQLTYAIQIGLLVLYLTAIYLQKAGTSSEAFLQADVLARYMIAIPGAALTTFALTRRGRELYRQDRRQIGRCFRLAAVGFGLYGLSQFFVPPAQIGLAPWLNTAAFMELTRIPIQVFRAGFGVLITYSLVSVITLMENERRQQMASAQSERLEALERVHDELVKREHLRRELIQRTVIAQEDERTRIARELHDESAQLLTGISLSLATLKTEIRQNSAAMTIIERLQELSREMSRQMHRMVHDLRPAQLDDLGLVPAIQYLLDEGRRSTGVEVKLEVSGERRQVDRLVETVIFRAVQESLNNIYRHAGVKTAQVSVVYCPELVRVSVVDQGAGFNTSAELVPPEGLGLAGMRERVEAVSGMLEITSAPQAGTRVEIVVPVVQPVTVEPVKENADGAGDPNHAG